MVVLSGFILNGKNAETMAKRLDAKLFDDLSNMEGLVDIVLSCDYLKDVKGRHKKSFLMRVCEHFRVLASYLLKYISLNSVSARLLKSFRCFHPTERKTARSLKDIGFIVTKLQVGVSRSDVLDDEWKLQQLDKDPDLVATTRVDEYWVNYLCREALEKRKLVEVLERVNLDSASGEDETGYSMLINSEP
ncbi:hypothetical protein QYM36_010197 [Artemia franciscana]|uniref:Uncharacterized protein n=1 Tax=Artemia franciscana TaxID=6661 RepID=A0AA88I503_ARTSF|nr:hypothetical protein QYM36_010197 [Artemia franciscana]